MFEGPDRHVRAVVAENATSRIDAGVHYSFDNDAWLVLGRAVARDVIEQDVRGALRGRWRSRAP
jgi:hypothetical protein